VSDRVRELALPSVTHLRQALNNPTVYPNAPPLRPFRVGRDVCCHEHGSAILDELLDFSVLPPFQRVFGHLAPVDKSAERNEERPMGFFVNLLKLFERRQSVTRDHGAERFGPFARNLQLGNGLGGGRGREGGGGEEGEGASHSTASPARA